MGTLLAVPMIRSMVNRGLHGCPLILGNYQKGLCRLLAGFYNPIWDYLGLYCEDWKSNGMERGKLHGD